MSPMTTVGADLIIHGDKPSECIPVWGSELQDVRISFLEHLLQCRRAPQRLSDVEI
jgi:hypothetical protein